jgi:L-threonylcarbamoyladenylate synthase
MVIVSRRYDCSDPLERTKGIADAVSVIRRGELVVLPTDTVYGIGADAFTPNAVSALLDAKGRGRDMPAPVLVGSVRAAQALVDDLGTYGQDLIDEFWPGALTIVCRANTTLAWDLGETKGTVAIRMPLHQLALELLKETGPMAVSSANRSGAAPARTAEEAETQLGDSVAVYLDDGPSGDDMPSSIVDLTGAVPRLLRAGAISEERLREVCGVLLSDEDDATPEPAGAADESASSAGTSAAKSAEDAPHERSEAAEGSQNRRSPVTDAEAKTPAFSERTDADKDTPPTDR